MMLTMRRAAAIALLATASPANAQSADFIGRVLAIHNAERTMTGAPGLAWDPALAAGAAVYAQQMAATGLFEHSDRKARPGVGENLWMGSRGAYRIDNMIGGWVGEKRHFVAGTFPNNSRSGNWLDVGHYTQMIWPTTQRVGCAIGSNGRNDYLVCRYSPKGNVDGRLVPQPRFPAERG